MRTASSAPQYPLCPILARDSEAEEGHRISENRPFWAMPTEASEGLLDSSWLGYRQRGHGAVMSKGATKQFVLAVFDGGVAADRAIRVLDAARATIGSVGDRIGVLALTPRGQIATDRLGPRMVGREPGVGAALGVIALALEGGVLPEWGPFFDAGSGLLTDDVARIGAELDAGHVVVAVLAENAQAQPVIAHLAQLGGKVESHRITAGALRRASTLPAVNA